MYKGMVAIGYSAIFVQLHLGLMHIAYYLLVVQNHNMAPIDFYRAYCTSVWLRFPVRFQMNPTESIFGIPIWMPFGGNNLP